MSAAIAIAMVPQPQLRGDGQQTISYTTAGIEKQPVSLDQWNHDFNAFDSMSILHNKFSCSFFMGG